MQESLITKKVIAYSLKKLMQDLPFEKISIRLIMEEADIRRQTFYDHFHDKYELLNWIFHQEISENVRDFLDYEEWPKVTHRTLTYFYQQQKFYRNAMSVTGQNSFTRYFLAHTQELSRTVIQDIARSQTFYPTDSQLDFYVAFLSQAFVGLTQDWLLNGCTETVESFAKNMNQTLKKTVTGLLI